MTVEGIERDLRAGLERVRQRGGELRAEIATVTAQREAAEIAAANLRDREDELSRELRDLRHEDGEIPW